MRRFLLGILASGALVFGLAALGGDQAPSNLLSQLRVHEAIQEGNLSIFPVSNSGGADISGFLTLDEGLSRGLVKVGELGALRGAGAMRRPLGERRGGDGRRPVALPTEAARVNELAIQNQSDQPLLLLAGEVVSGGKQDRVVGRDRIVPPHSEPIPLDVFCVEPGRWHGLSAEFAASKSMAHPKLRQEVTEAKNQQKVWEEVAQSRDQVAQALAAPAAAPASGVGPGRGGVEAARLPSVSETVTVSSSYAQMMEAAPVKNALDGRIRRLAHAMPKDCIGVVVALNGRVVWGDVFASPALFARYRDKLLQSYLVEAMRTPGSGGSVTLAEAGDFLRPLTGRQTIDVEPGVYRLARTEASGTVTYQLDWIGGRPATLHLARMTQ